MERYVMLCNCNLAKRHSVADSYCSDTKQGRGAIAPQLIESKPMMRFWSHSKCESEADFQMNTSGGVLVVQKH